MSINEIIKQRRSHFAKEFTGEKIEDSIVNQLLENAHWAPSHALTLPWRFYVFQNESLTTLTSLMAELYKKQTLADKFKEEKYNNILQLPNKVSHAIAIGMKRDERSRVPEIEEIAAVACAVQNIYLSLTQFENVGGYWSTGSGTYTDEMKTFLGLSKEDSCMGFFMLGKVLHKRTESTRVPFSDFVKWM